MDTKPGIEINPFPKQYEAWLALQNPAIREIHYGGGAGGGKSWLGCESRLVRAISMPGYKSFIGRKQLSDIMKTTMVTWLKVCKFYKIPQSDWKLNGKYNYIEFKNGSRIDLLDLAFQPSDPMYEDLGSLEYTDAGWVEEAGEVYFMAIDILRSRGGRHLNNEYNFIPDSLYTYNPNKGWVYRIYKKWKDGTLPPDVVFIQSLYGDNPYTRGIYGEQLKRIEDPAMRKRLMLGSFEYDDDPTSLMKYDAVVDLFSNTVHDDGAKAMTIDVARHGVDKTVIYLWRGWTIVGVRIYQKQDTNITSQKARDIARDREIPYSRIVPDEDGIGGGVVDQLQGVRGFVANSTPMPNQQTGEHENYANLKAQCSYLLASKVNGHKMAIKIDPGEFVSEIPGLTFEIWRDQLIEELDHIKSKKTNADTKLRIMSKEEVKEQLGRSPDFADTAMMRALLDYEQTNIRRMGVKIIMPKNYRGFGRR